MPATDRLSHGMGLISYGRPERQEVFRSPKNGWNDNGIKDIKEV
jgi:hypothetical protein